MGFNTATHPNTILSKTKEYHIVPKEFAKGHAIGSRELSNLRNIHPDVLNTLKEGVEKALDAELRMPAILKKNISGVSPEIISINATLEDPGGNGMSYGSSVLTLDKLSLAYDKLLQNAVRSDVRMPS